MGSPVTGVDCLCPANTSVVSQFYRQYCNYQQQWKSPREIRELINFAINIIPKRAATSAVNIQTGCLTWATTIFVCLHTTWLVNHRTIWPTRIKAFYCPQYTWSRCIYFTLRFIFRTIYTIRPACLTQKQNLPNFANNNFFSKKHILRPATKSQLNVRSNLWPVWQTWMNAVLGNGIFSLWE